ncbi:MAG: hypothetical protein V3V28_03575 [Polaribacter sp.]|uniref:hypothetical protein n=1 Tax=Polaribacter sp. TaxID=1920175 RepID=UPI002F35B0C3
MEAQQSIISEIYKDISFTPEEIALIHPILKKRTLKKGDILIKLYFINIMFLVAA